MAPRGLFERLPVAQRLQAERQHPLRFVLLLGYQAHDILVQSPFDDLRMDIGGEPELIFLLGNAAHQLVAAVHCPFFLLIFHCGCKVTNK